MMGNMNKQEAQARADQIRAYQSEILALQDAGIQPSNAAQQRRYWPVSRWNRSGEPEAGLVLSERECSLVRQNQHRENNGVACQQKSGEKTIT